MENYLVSARKYRPATFDTVVGQGALTETLKNAIATHKLAHAYLFCGPRGVGKTTCARIFAKTINCLELTPSGEACNSCESCVAFNEQRSYNIHELDAASNNSVEDIRQLVDMVRIPPQIGKYKVYIIDEVHMLSTAAFNAFLKTLEEPPAHAVFILATTEKHKILPTILSRCQIYDFNRIGVKDIVDHLIGVAEQENVKVEPEALNVIALKADGGMRDALSIFDQTVSFTRGNITYKAVLENLNVLDYEYYFSLTDAFLANDAIKSLLLFNQILDQGFEGGQFVTGLTSHFRDLLVSKDEVSLPLLQVGASIRSRYLEQAKLCSSKMLFQGMKLCTECDLNLRVSKNKRLLVELTLIQLSQLTQDDEGSRPSGQTNNIKPVSQSTSAEQPQKPAKPVNMAQTNTELHDSKVAYKPEAIAKASTQTAEAKPIHDGGVADFLKGAGPAKRKLPSVKVGDLGVSIKREQHRQAADSGVGTSAPTQAKQAKKDSSFTESDLNYQWQSYANRMPIEQKALAVRMQAMRITLLDAHSFEMVVDNELVARDFIELSPHIQSFMRSALHNDFIKMQVRVSEANENNRAYNRTDKYQLMVDKNKYLNDLRTEFGLEFN